MENLIFHAGSKHKNALKKDVIWGQCVGCKDYDNSIQSKILEAAGRGAKFKMIVNSSATVITEFRALYDPLQGSEVIEGNDNNLRVYGLSNKEVLLGFPSVLSYTSILIKEPHFVKIVKKWFDERFEKIKKENNINKMEA